MNSLSIGRPAQVIGIVVSVLCIGGIVWWASAQEAPKFPTGSDILLVVAGIGLYAIATLLRGERWFQLLEAARTKSGRADAYALVTVGYMGNNVLPARGGDAIRVVLQTPRSKASARTVVGTLLAERVADVLFLLSLFAVLAYGLLRDLDTPGGAALAIAVAVGALLLLVLLAIVRIAPDHPRIQRTLDWVMPILQPTAALRGAHGGRVAVLTVAIWLVEIATYIVVIDSIGPNLGPLDGAYLVAVASVFVLIPSGPGYIGTFDTAILFGLGALDVTGSVAISSAILLRFVLTVPITTVGFLVLVSRYGGWKTMMRKREATT